MDYVKREDYIVTDEESYKVYIESLQKSHQIDAEFQHTQISMEQLHQAMQSSLNATSLVHNLQIPLSPRQMSTLMFKTSPLSRNLNFDLPTHLPRNLTSELDLVNNFTNDLPQNLRQDDLLTQNLNLARSLSNDIELQNSLSQTLVPLTEDLRINDANMPQNLRVDMPHDLSHEMDLSHHLNRQNIEQEILNQERRTPIVIQSVQDRHLLEQSLGQRLEQHLSQRIEPLSHRLDQRLETNLVQRLELNMVRNDQNVPRLDQNGQRIEQSLASRLDQGLVIHESQRGESVMLPSLPVPFHIKMETDPEDDTYFYDFKEPNEGLNNISGLNEHIPTNPEQNYTNSTTLQDNQMYSVYNNLPSLPALNPIDLYSRPNYLQNYTNNTRDNPQNLVVHKQYENASPYPHEEIKKLRQDGGDDTSKSDVSKEEPKENLKPNENKMFYEYQNDYSNGEKNENDSSLQNKICDMNIKGEYVCYKCNDVFPTRRALKQHSKACLETKEAQEKIGKFACTQCPYKCQSPAILKIHERTHSGERPFSCTFCDYKSGQKNNVAKHILVHMKQKPFGCQYCEYRCAQKNNLVVHERTHTGYKPFACPYCDYRTVQKPNLVKHMYLHTDQKPFSCDMCSYRCVQKTNLTKHKQRHLNEKGDKIDVKNESKPYRPRQKSVKCPYCSYRCVQKSSLDKHIQFKHSDESQSEGLNLMKNNVSKETIQNLSVKKGDVFDSMCHDPLQIAS